MKVRVPNPVYNLIMIISGSGNHSIYNTVETLAANINTSHFVYAGICLTMIQLDRPNGEVVYETQNPASSDNERPLIIAPGE